MQYLKPMNESSIGFADFVYQSRLQALAGIDEIVEDVIAKLEDKGIIDNTYSMYRSSRLSRQAPFLDHMSSWTAGV